jgi:hypothetical protein
MSVVYQVDLLLINGPGTCVPVALCHFITRGWRQIIYVESICRYTDTVRWCRSKKIYLGEDKPIISASPPVRENIGEDKPTISAFLTVTSGQRKYRRRQPKIPAS